MCRAFTQYTTDELNRLDPRRRDGNIPVIITKNRRPKQKRPERIPVLTTPLVTTIENDNIDNNTNDHRLNSKHGLKIGHINAQSMAPKVDEINVLLETHDLDILCVSETWLTDKIPSRFMVFPGYEILRYDRQNTVPGSKSKGGGVAIIHRDEITCHVLDMPKCNLIEMLWISISWKGGIPAVVGVAYRPPNGSVTLACDELCDQLKLILAKGKPSFLLGDLNINVLNQNSAPGKCYQQMLDELDLKQLITEPTHLSPTPTAIDHIITNVKLQNNCVEVLDTAISDHQPIVMKTPLHRVRNNATRRVGRKWNCADWNAICLHLLLEDWSELDDTTDVNKMVESFKTIWDRVINRHCPLTTKKSRSPNHPWIANNQTIKRTMQTRDDMLKIWRDLRTPESRSEFCCLRNEVKRLIHQARKEYLGRRLMSANRRDFWQTLKRHYMSQPKKSAGVKRDEDQNKDEQRSRADRFNEFFASVGSCIACELKDDVKSGQKLIKPPIVISSCFKPYPVTLPELSRVMRQMNSSGAEGIDGVPLKALKRCFAVVGPYLLRIVNTSISTSIFPESWKIAEVVPIYKNKGDINTAANFRPISLLSHMSKLLEKVVCNQLSAYLTRCNVLYPQQYAYRPKHGTEDALLDVADWITQNSERGEVSSVTAVDLSKAFDSVDHSVLLNKLGWYGIDDAWFRSYLTGRKQIVRGGSRTISVSCGVPQGSIAGPVLFSLFTNDMHCHLLKSRIICYADDTQLLDHSDLDSISLNSLKIRIETALNTLQCWFRSNSLKMNKEKTDFILVGTRNAIEKTKELKLSVAGCIIKPSKTVRLLGVDIDPYLSWEAHITQVVKRCNSLLIPLRRFQHHFTQDALKVLVEAHVQPHILYGLSVWGGTTKKQLTRVQKVINFSARVVTGMKRRDRVGPVLESLCWRRIEDQVRERDLLKIHKSIHSEGGPKAIRGMFVMRHEVSRRTTRSTETNSIELPVCHLTNSQRQFRYRATKSWNDLPYRTMNEPSPARFERLIRSTQ